VELQLKETDNLNNYNMIHINEIKISLMEKEKDFNINENGKGNYIIKSSATFLPDKYLFERNSHSDLGWQFQTEAIKKYYLSMAKDVLDIVKNELWVYIAKERE